MSAAASDAHHSSGTTASPRRPAAETSTPRPVSTKTAIDSAALLVYRAAWTRDSGAPRITREAAMAKMVATENAQGVIDRAVQLHGGEGVRSGSVPETLYREIRALRIYEGATEVQKLIIARQLLSQAA